MKKINCAVSLASAIALFSMTINLLHAEEGTLLESEKRALEKQSTDNILQEKPSEGIKKSETADIEKQTDKLEKNKEQSPALTQKKENNRAKQQEADAQQKLYSSDEPETTASIKPRPTIQQDFALKLETETQGFTTGQAITLKVKSSEECYLSIINKDPDGQITVLFPNRLDQDNHIDKDSTFYFPQKDNTYALKLNKPGKEKFVAICAQNNEALANIKHQFDTTAFTPLEKLPEIGIKKKNNDNKGLANKDESPIENENQLSRVEINIDVSNKKSE
jgi:hypothetical protein